ncbi:caspase domain-containing protein [Mycena floridula]|nr:caspase domain-containing protein [Mycena floridula]
MMWDFSGSYANGHPHPPPGFPPQQQQAGYPGQPVTPFPSSSPYASPPYAPSPYGLGGPGPSMSANHLNVPQPNMPIPQAHSDGHHHRSHHHHHHHRSHSNPPPADRALGPVQVIRHTHHHSQPVVIPTPHRHHTPAPQVSRPHHHQEPRDHFFQYSKCTGKKKALCIGINYRGQDHELRGCINDARHMRDFLVGRCGYKKGDIVLLTDDSPDPRKRPTRVNIMDAMKWLVEGAHTHDSLFFHYSGHGAQVPDTDGDETDGLDEVIFPLDYKRHGHILDDEMHKIMVKPLPVGCRLTAVFDSCHSGTVLDLPFIYSSSGRLRGSHVSRRARQRKSTPADVISWSGCRDDQTSADTFNGRVAVGAMSSVSRLLVVWIMLILFQAFIRALTERPKQSYQELLKSVRTILHPRYSQKPQLGSSHPIDTSLGFII